MIKPTVSSHDFYWNHRRVVNKQFARMKLTISEILRMFVERAKSNN